jgi:hypothetical protein
VAGADIKSLLVKIRIPANPAEIWGLVQPPIWAVAGNGFVTSSWKQEVGLAYCFKGRLDRISRNKGRRPGFDRINPVKNFKGG